MFTFPLYLEGCGASRDFLRCVPALRAGLEDRLARAERIQWMVEGPELFEGWCRPWWPARRFVTVEAVPATDEWDWAVWIGDRSGRALSGTAVSLVAAMAEAEWAAAQLGPEATALPGSARSPI